MSAAPDVGEDEEAPVAVAGVSSLLNLEEAPQGVGWVEAPPPPPSTPALLGGGGSSSLSSSQLAHGLTERAAAERSAAYSGAYAKDSPSVRTPSPRLLKERSREWSCVAAAGGKPKQDGS